jgi:hypothetical protein
MRHPDASNVYMLGALSNSIARKRGDERDLLETRGRLFVRLTVADDGNFIDDVRNLYCHIYWQSKHQVSARARQSRRAGACRLGLLVSDDHAYGGALWAL